jgi:predicted HAD superfamily phosphohydrolase YqeG
MSSLGYGQTWQVVTGSRSLATTYYNTTGKPISVAFYAQGVGSANNTIIVAGTTITTVFSGAAAQATVTFVVPISQSYSVGAGAAITTWSELR